MLFLLTALITFSLPALASSSFLVVLDPGHGGADEGAVFYQGKRKITEKDVTLKIALQVARYLRRENIAVELTRSRDKELTLPLRTALANRLSADLFISIHMNSKPGFNKGDIEGIETYILNTTTDASSRRLARLENSVMSRDTKEDDLALILKDHRLDANLHESKTLACLIQSHLVLTTSSFLTQHRRNRGVKQSLFHVLLGADMPSVLIEAGFLSHPKDRALATSPSGQAILGQAIAKAIQRHRSSKESHFRLPPPPCKLS